MGTGSFGLELTFVVMVLEEAGSGLELTFVVMVLEEMA
jgi:hypothetical protein